MNNETTPGVHCNLTYTRAIVNNSTDDMWCDCVGGYSGATCETRAEWWLPLKWFRATVASGLLLWVIMWAVLKIVHSLRYGHWKTWRDIAAVAVLLVIAGSVCRIASLWVPEDMYVHVNARTQQEPVRLATYGALYTLGIMCFIVAFNTVVGFWMDTLRRGLNRALVTRVKTVSIILGVSVGVLAMGTLTLSVILMTPEINSPIIVGITLLDTLIMFVMLAYIRLPCGGGKMFTKTARASSDAYSRWRYMMFYLQAAAGAWVAFIASALLTTFVYVQPGRASLRPIFAFMTVFSEAAYAIMLMKLMDRNGGLLRLWDDLVDYKRDTIHQRKTRNTSTTPEESLDKGTPEKPKLISDAYTARQSTVPSNAASHMATISSDAIGRSPPTQRTPSQSPRECIISSELMSTTVSASM